MKSIEWIRLLLCGLIVDKTGQYWKVETLADKFDPPIIFYFVFKWDDEPGKWAQTNELDWAMFSDGKMIDTMEDICNQAIEYKERIE